MQFKTKSVIMLGLIFLLWMNVSSGAQQLSAASKRALNYTLGPGWFCQFRVSDLKGSFKYEQGNFLRMVYKR